MKQITIKTTKDVQHFFQFLYDEYDLDFHPDDSFHQYINRMGARLFTEEEADYLDIVMQSCFDVCELKGTMIYEVLESVKRKEYIKRGFIL